MAHVTIMPRQGNTVESCVIVGWKVAEGDAVESARAICEVETDKASFEVPAGADGIVLKILHPEGADVPVLRPIAVVGTSGEDWRTALAGGAAPETRVPGGEGDAPGRTDSEAVSGTGGAVEPDSGASAVFSGDGDAASAAASPRAKRIAASRGVSLAGLRGTGPGGRIIERDVRGALEAAPGLTAGARSLAGTTAVLPAGGTALGGRIGTADLARAAGSAVAPGEGRGTPVAAGDSSAPARGFAPAAASGDGEAAREVALPSGDDGSRFPGPFTDTPVRGVRRIIADRMRASLAQSAQLTLHASAPADRLLALRARFKEGGGGGAFAGVTIGDLVLAATARTLAGFPALNAHFRGDGIRSFARVHLGFAVDTPRGLMVPVLRDADRLGLAELSAGTRRLAAACQNGTVLPDELSGSTFTVTNLGAFGIESFTPVLNTPEVGILGVCAILDRPVARPDGQGAGIEKRIGLSLTLDHQAVDGAPGARFLQALSAAIADIDLVMMK